MPMLNIDGTTINFTVKGEGIPLVFIHPPTLTSVNFQYQLEELSQYFKVITFDIRGHGKSSYSSTPITYQLIVEDIKRILDHLEIDKAFVCGYSTGGSIVLEFLLTSHHRAFGGVIISGMSEVRDNYLKNKISLGVKLAKAGLVPVLALGISKSNSTNFKLFKKMFTDAKQGDSRNIEQYYACSLHYNCTNRLKNINLPTILIYGKKDEPFHPYAKILHEQLPNNELKFIENVDHRVPTKAANELHTLIRQFVNKHHHVRSF
ncbi:pimeloyl-ACP methyl ester carboxylesterase [Bacillus mesophilus]|uniref:Alpha/beta hydrolase n=1 Tax=Bacillus mesophilus TaxID=1808955 RepID=A0A6M0Q3T0_9BACI|nr:alpha/beta hydrolase [Bacillus mesophilus]MBM7660357.1 pimeloyl-ACP methyl ester carboxylesterase [Bacillus mesophilus]NEY71066.1 alpha/beta hydrolase [Bacillus mesophilus]